MLIDRGLLAVIALVFVFLGPPTALADTERSGQLGGLLSEVNRQRVLNGAAPLKLNDRLTVAAQKHARDMAERDFFDHRSPDGRGYQERVSSEGYPWRVIAENLGAGLSSPKTTVNAWMTSDGHRENMLNRKFKDVGIGYFRPNNSAQRARYSQYWVILFATRSR